jgi:riboflavin kinase/FMN adenylyltransferase
MQVWKEPKEFPRRPPGSAVTVGAYDGVHLGHQAVLAELRRRADDRQLPTVVVTFDRHPAAVVRPESVPLLLTDLDQKLEVLASTGSVDHVLILRFDRQRAAEEPEDFVDEVLVDALGARLVVVGEDFHFGRRRRGNVALLQAEGARRGFDVVGLGLVGGGGPMGQISSTAVRRLLTEGDVAGVSSLLGRPYEVRGVVEAGDRRGREVLGFPTANLRVAEGMALPAPGIYAGHYVRPDGSALPAAISLGSRPTFYPEGGPVVLEAYLLDFEGDLYGERGRVRFAARLRADSATAHAESASRANLPSP